MATPDSRLPVAFMRDPERRLTKRTFRLVRKDSSSDDSETSSDDSDDDSDDDDDDDDDSSSSGSSASSSSASGSGSSSSLERTSTASSSSSSSVSSASSSSSSSSTSSSSRGDRGGDSGFGSYSAHSSEGGVFAIDEEAQDGIMGSLNRFRYRYAARRRHAGLLKIEERDAAAAEAHEMDCLERERATILQQKKVLKMRVQRMQRNEFLDRVAREDRQRFEQQLSLRAKRLQSTRVLMGILEDVGLDDDRRREEREEEAAAEEKARREQEVRAKLEARREGLAKGEERARADDEALSQSTLRLMRRAGVISGVNPAAPEQEPEQRETATHVQLFVKPTEAAEIDRKRQSKRDFTLFTVDLRRFKNAESIKGERAIGRDGAVFLAFALSGGACPRLRVLNLGWNLIKRAGCERLLDAFGKLGRACLIEVLDLRMNHLPGACVSKLCGLLCRDLKGRGEPVLKMLHTLDLRQNLIADEGGVALAHAALAGGLRTLRRLNVSGNQMADQGVRALHKAFSSEAIAELCPHVQGVNCRDNSLDASTTKSMDPCPLFFQV